MPYRTVEACTAPWQGEYMSATAVSHSRGSGISRLLRGWVVATIAVVLAAGGHQAAHRLVHGSAETIPLQLLAFSIAVTAPVAVAFAGRGPSKRTAATTIFGQIAFHLDRKSTRLNSSHVSISYAVFCLKKKTVI